MKFNKPVTAKFKIFLFTWIDGLFVGNVSHVVETWRDEHAQARVDDEDKQKESNGQVNRYGHSPVLLWQECHSEGLLEK